MENLARRERLFRTTLTVTLVIIVSKLCGFARDMITANYFGTGIESDAYTAAYSMFYLPVLLFNSCITSTLVPLFVQAEKDGGPRAANRFGSNSFNLFALAALVIAAIMYVFAGPLVRLVYSGFSPEKLELTAQLTRIMMLSLVFNVTSIVMSTLLNAREKFMAAQLTGFPLSLAVIVAAVCFSGRYGIQALAWGVFVSGVLQVLIQMPFFFGWFKYSAYIDLADPRFRQLLTLAVPAMLSMAVSELNHMIDHWLASGLGDGTMTALNYAYKLITFISGILVVPLTTVIFSKLSKLVANRDTKGIAAVIRRCMETISLVLVPIILICAVLRVDVIRFAYGSGRFDDRSIQMTSGAFLFYVIGVLTFGLRDLLNRAFHAMKDTRTPFRVGCLAVVLNVILNFILRALMGANGLALATTLAGATAMAVLLRSLSRRLGGLGLKRTGLDLVKVLAGGAVCALVCWTMDRAMAPAAGRIMVFFRLAAISLVSLGCYGLVELLLQERQLAGISRAILGKLKGGKSSK